MRAKLFLPLIFLMVTVANAQAGIIYGQLSGIPENGKITYGARVGDNWKEILTEDGFNSELGLDEGYQNDRLILNRHYWKYKPTQVLSI